MLIKQALLEKGWGPGGWSFHQPETNWTAPNPLGTSFAQQVNNIVKHRQANPRFHLATDPVQVAQELEIYTLNRWRSVYSEHGLSKFLENPPEDQRLKKKSNVSTFTSTPRKSLLGKAAELVAGVDTTVVEEWLGEGGIAVPPSTASTRAHICAGCRGNQKSGWRDLLTVAAAKALREYLSAKNHLRLSTPLDAELGLCTACKCVLELKVHCPDKHIYDNLDLELTNKLLDTNVNCWILRLIPLSTDSHQCDMPA